MNALRTCFLGLALLLTVLSCTDEISNRAGTSTEGREAMVALSLRTVAETNGMAETRAVTDYVDEGTQANYQVKDFWLLEYNQMGTMIGTPHYYEMSELTADNNPTLPVILPEGDETYTCIVIANTHFESLKDLFSKATTLEQLKTLSQYVRAPQDLYNTTATGYDLLMNGTTTVNKDTKTLTCNLYRNVAKLTLKLTNRQNSGVKINSVQLRNVPNSLFYADQLYTADAAPCPTTSQSGFLDWAVEPNEITSGVKTLELHYYLPRNCRGDKTDNTLASQKSHNAPRYATFVEIMAVEEGKNTQLRYRFYLGKDMVKNFDLLPNHHYILPITIKDKGDAENDSRVEDMSEVELTEAANSYIINPLKEGEQPLHHLTIVDRVNAFWTKTDLTKTIQSNTQWVAEVIWQDKNERLINFCDKDGNVVEGNIQYQGTGMDHIHFKPTGASGNVLIGVKLPNSGIEDYLWSWHLWITDYNPDYTATWDKGVYAYPVDGGEVHRYAGNADGTNVWDKQYKNKYIMDRNLGAMTATPGKTSYGFHYQFGRKDPLPQPTTTLYNIKGEQIQLPAANNDCIPIVSQAKAYSESVQKPYAFYKGGTTGSNSWMIDNPTINNDALWYNPRWYDTPSSQKSLFDPCPPGWKVPERGTWNCFSNNGFNISEITAQLQISVAYFCSIGLYFLV